MDSRNEPSCLGPTNCHVPSGGLYLRPHACAVRGGLFHDGSHFKVKRLKMEDFSRTYCSGFSFSCTSHIVDGRGGGDSALVADRTKRASPTRCTCLFLRGHHKMRCRQTGTYMATSSGVEAERRSIPPTPQIACFRLARGLLSSTPSISAKLGDWISLAL